MGIHPFGDPRLVDDFEQVDVAFDPRPAAPTTGVSWSPDRVDYDIDGRVVKDEPPGADYEIAADARRLPLPGGCSGRGADPVRREITSAGCARRGPARRDRAERSCSSSRRRGASGWSSTGPPSSAMSARAAPDALTRCDWPRPRADEHVRVIVHRRRLSPVRAAPAMTCRRARAPDGRDWREGPGPGRRGDAGGLVLPETGHLAQVQAFALAGAARSWRWPATCIVAATDARLGEPEIPVRSAPVTLSCPS